MPFKNCQPGSLIPVPLWIESYHHSMRTTPNPVEALRRSSGRLYVWLGIALVLLGPALYLIQVWAKILIVPWYAPLCATVGFGLLTLALVRARTIWRVLLVMLFGLLTAFLWFFVVSSQLPVYSGPVAAGNMFPDFTTTLADGSTFNQKSLQGDQNTVMVFYRGHW